MAFLAFALIARSTLFSPIFLEAVRALALIVAAFMAFLGLLQVISLERYRSYWLQIGYLFALVLSTLGTEDPLYVSFHVLSVLTVVFLSIVCYELKDSAAINSALLTATFWAYLMVTTSSLALVLLKPQVAYEIQWWGEMRFRGILPKAGMMGADAGVLLGLVFFTKRNVFVRLCALMTGGACLVLTQSRTFWVATVVAGLFTYWVYYRQNRGMLLGAVALGLVALLTVYALDLGVKVESAKRFARVESITNLTGRVQLWKKALEAFGERPILGYGLTAGSTSLSRTANKSMDKENSIDESRAKAHATMHNGYIQSLLDVGIFGTFFYVALVIRSILLIYRYDGIRTYPAEFYLLLFLGISNISENIINAATIFNSVLFWVLAGFATHLKSQLGKPNVLNNAAGTNLYRKVGLHG